MGSVLSLTISFSFEKDSVSAQVPLPFKNSDSTDAAFKTGWYDEIRIFVYVGNDASRRVALKCGYHLDYDAYKETVYTDYGNMESEECFCKTIAEHEWGLRGQHFFTTARLDNTA